MDNTLIYPYLLLQLFLSYYFTSHLLTDIWYTNKTGKSSNWTYLPLVPCPFGSVKKLTNCTGCRTPIDIGTPVHKCMFYSKGFTCKNITFQACEVIYHPQCIRVGSPFRTRHYGKGTRGTQYPPSATILPFICELCTTRTHLQRELDPNCQQDALLLMLERMRMIDTAHAWDHKTVQNMCNTLKGVDQFFQNFSLPPIHRQLDLSPLKHPPLDIAIPLFWSMEHYTTAPSTRSRGFAPS